MSTLEMEQPPVDHFEAITPPEIGRHGDVLRELFTLNDETVTELRPRLWDMAERVASQVIDPAQQKAIAMYAAAADWHVFGKPGDPIPEGLVVAVAESTGEPDIVIDSRIPWMNYSLQHVDGAMNRLGFRDLVDQAYDDVRQRTEQIKGVVEDVVRNSAEYQLLASFDQPLSKPESSLLTPFWRRIREGQIEQDVKRRYGLEIARPIPVGTDAARAYSRQMYQLDDETMIQPQQPKSQYEAILRARSYLTSYVKQAYEARDGHGEFAEVYYDEDNGLSIRGTDYKDEYDGHEFYDYASDAAEILSGEIYIGPSELRQFSEVFLDYAILKLMDPRIGGSLKEVIESAIEESTSHILWTLKDGIAPEYGGFGSGFGEKHAAVFLRGTNGEHIGRAQLDDERQYLQNTRGYNWEPFFRGQSLISTYSELMRSKQARLGQIESYRPQNFRVSGRLLLEGSEDVELPKEVQHEDLVLKVDGIYGAVDMVPLVPGYKLVSKRGFAFNHRYGFVVSPEGDPYRECSVIINEKRRALLSDAYAEIGLHQLAAQVKGTSRLTVAQLTNMIKGASVYFLPDMVETNWEIRPYGDGPLNRRISYKDSLQDFSSSVKDGRLYVQCSGAAHFLRYSLDRAFGQGSAGYAGGYVIRDNNSVINMTQHAQTVFTHKGKQYLLDATPSADLGNHLVPLDEATGRTHRQTAAKAPQLEQASHDDNITELKIIHDRPEKPLDEDVVEQIESLTKRLVVAFDVSNEEQLYKKLVRLPRHDPVRVTYELLVQFGIGKLSDEEVFETVKYIENCANATPIDRRKIGVDHYSNELIQQLESTAWHLKWAIEKARKPENSEPID